MKYWGVFIGLILIAALSGAATPIAGREGKDLNVVTSIFPLKEFAQSVLGERGTVTQLLPPGAEVHTWSPRPTDLVRLTRADVFIYMSEQLEPWARDILDSVGRRRIEVVEMAHGKIPGVHSHDTEEAEHSHEDPGESDPHIWLDFSQDQVFIDRVKDILSALSPDDSDYFTANANEYKHSLQRMDETYRRTLGRCSQKTFILGGHAAFGHLARRYGLTQVALYGLSPDSQPKPRQMARTVDLAKKLRAKVIFFEIFVSDELARVLAREVGAEIRILNPGVNLTTAQIKEGVTFLQLMEDNLENLKYGLSCPGDR